jgi:hypothetical protein
MRRGKAPAPPTSAGAHAPDFRWVVGRLEHDAECDRWYISYADGGPNEPHEEALELVGVRPPAGLVAGNVVRVAGQRLDLPGEGSRGAYLVSSLQLAAPPAAK